MKPLSVGMVFLALWILPAEAGLQPRVLRGDVVLRNNGDAQANLVVLVDSVARGHKRNGVADYVIGIRGSGSYGAVSEQWSDAQVTIEPERVTIYSERDFSAVILDHGDNGRPPWLPADTAMRWFSGFAISVSDDAGESLPLRTDLPGLDFWEPGDPSDGGGYTSCSAGGSGSTSCSISCRTGNETTCSVSCSSGYFACCRCDNVVGARCKCRNS